MSITPKSIEIAAQELKVYDVDQAGWEHEDYGFEFNANHVLKHLVRDISRKDFFDPTAVETQIAPDSLQYALRLARWSGIRSSQILPTVETADEVLEFANNRHLEVTRLAAYELAQSRLADHLHDLDHQTSREAAMQNRWAATEDVGKFLTYFAGSSAVAFRFNLSTAFSDRLAEIRQRREIPQPQ